MSLDELYEVLKRKRGFRAGDPASPLEIEQIERGLGITLVEEYKDFLRRFGYARWFGHAIYGVYLPGNSSAPSYDYDTVRWTLQARSELLPDVIAPLPRDANILDRYDAGGYYILFSHESSKAGSVALIDHEQQGQVSQEWSSFEEFVRWLVR